MVRAGGGGRASYRAGRMVWKDPKVKTLDMFSNKVTCTVTTDTTTGLQGHVYTIR